MYIKKAYIKKGVGGHLEEIVKGLLPKDTGYVEVQHDVSDHEHPTHTHPTDEILHVLEGSIYFTVEGNTTLCEAGDRIFLPKHTVHSSKAGPGGCTYVISILKE
ncbi:mannose-6-phosphate isomerase-like protein (cupin superfamily) [Bacillus fengqiuensis]|nr:mannose-6-phosphate isomerase-like protein (cupin superfamily) [Bacillus fengqiuensis]